MFHVVGTSFYLMSFSDYLTALAFALTLQMMIQEHIRQERWILRTGLGYLGELILFSDSRAASKRQ
jgi:hypothetical protein